MLIAEYLAGILPDPISKSMKKLILVLLPLFFGISVLSFSSTFFINDSGAIGDIAQYSWSLFVIIAILRIAYEGSFRKSPLNKLGYLGIGIFVVGALMKIQHWTESSLFIFSGSMIIIVGYVAHFSRKSNKEALDWLKLIYALITVVTVVLRLLHISSAEVWLWLIMVATLILVATWYFQQLQHKEESYSELADDDKNIFRQEL